MNSNEIKEIAWIYSLQNAIYFKGRANDKAVIGKVIAVLRKKGYSPEEIIPIVRNIVEKVNGYNIEKQKKELEKIAPELLKKEKKERIFTLPDLPNAKKGHVVTRFPPEPNGYLHIGHAKAVIVDYNYSRMYDGKFILRFDDTNPENAMIDFYDAQKEDLNWLGIEWDLEYNTSDNLGRHYKLAEQLIRQGDAYICTCESDFIKECRFEGTDCDCRGVSDGESIDIWKQMLTSSVEGAILRLRGDMSCSNTAMRDPTLFRIIDKPHPVHGEKYRVWPTYDFAGAIEDSISGVTHPFRTKEYELRDECYYRLLDLLNLRKPNLMEFARLSIEGMPVSKRKIKPLIDKGYVNGYDDIRLPTLRGLSKRGILPESIKQFVFSQGISKVESNVTFGIVEAFNRKIVDPNSRRYYFVKNPVKLIVSNAPDLLKDIKFHPNNTDLGSRKIRTKSTFFIQNEDLENLGIGDIFRLKDLFNVRINKKKNDIVYGEYVGKDLIYNSLKIQWTTEDFIRIKVFIPHLLFKDGGYNKDSLEVIEGYAEDSIGDIQSGDIIQFERFGFVRIENINGKITGFFSHK